MEDHRAKRKRPFGVYMIILLLLLRVLSISLDMGRIRMGMTPLVLPIINDQLAVFAVPSVIDVIILMVCIGLFLLKRWAWIAVMILIGINLIYGIASYLNGGQPFTSLLLDVISVFYLNLRSVQEAFEGQHAADPEVAP